MCSRSEHATNWPGSLRFLSAAIFAILFQAWAIAQPQPAQRQNAVAIDHVDFGFAGLVPTETWSPLTVWLRAGEKGFSGALVVEYDQDETQRARIIVPAAATPGTIVTVQATVCLPLNVRHIELSVFNQDGRRVAQGEYWSYPQGTQASWNSTAEPGGSIVLQIGDLSLRTAIPSPDTITAGGVDSRPLGVGLPPEKAYLEELRLVRAQGSLPVHWTAYTGLALLAVRAEEAERLDPRVLEAVHRWVSSGGRLLIVAAKPGAAWRSWLPPGEMGDVVQPAEVRRVTSPPSLREVVASTDGLLKETLPGLQSELVGPEARLLPATAAAQLLARPISTTSTGAAHGWAVRHRLEEAQGLARDSGLIAEGPIGFGWVVVLGFEPELAPAIAEKPGTIVVWEDAVHSALGTFAAGRAIGAHDRFTPYYYGEGSSSAPTRESQQAVAATLDSICRVSPPRMTLFFVIAGCLLALAALVGPVDRYLLRRANLPHLSVGTAILWTLLASGAAMVAPSLCRSDRSSVARARVVDCLPVSEGIDRMIGWRSGITAVFADSRSEFQLEDADASSWWRGIGASWWYGYERIPGFSALSCTQSLPSPGAPPPGCTPGTLLQGQWTLRCFQDDGPEPRVVRAAIERTEHACAIRVTGLADGATIARAVLQVGTARAVFEPRASAGTPGALLTSDTPPRAFAGPVQPWVIDRSETLFLPALRSQAIDARLATGEWACLFLEVSEPRPEFGITVPAEQFMTSVYRVLLSCAGEFEEIAP